MAALMKSGRALRNIINSYSISSSKLYSTENDNISTDIGSHDTNYHSVDGLATADDGQTNRPVGDPAPGAIFASLLRKSKFVQIGDLRKTVVVGEIFEVVDDDLYIDFGSKFHCVCKKPRRRFQQDERRFQRGSKVQILLQDYEMTASFRGTSKDITLLEADATLLGSVASDILRDEKVRTFQQRTSSKERTNWEEKEPSVDIRTFLSDADIQRT